MRTVTTRTSACGVLFSLLLTACSSGESPPAAAPAGPASGQNASGAPDTEVPEDIREVVAENLPYAEVQDELVYGHFAFPVDMVDPLPAVILVHDWWGLNDDVRADAERLAASGYIVLAIDLFMGESVDGVSAARRMELDVLENPRRAADNIRQAIDFLRVSSAPPGLAILGFGFGGGWALNTALERPGAIDAVISFYGQVVTDTDVDRLSVPFLGFFAESDRAVPITTVRNFERTAEALDKDVELRVFDDARRGFAERSSDSYDADTTDEAWVEMLAYLDARFADPR